MFICVAVKWALTSILILDFDLFLIERIDRNQWALMIEPMLIGFPACNRLIGRFSDRLHRS